MKNEASALEPALHERLRHTLGEFKHWHEVYEFFADKFEREHGSLGQRHDDPAAFKARERVWLFNDVVILLRDELTGLAKERLAAAGRLTPDLPPPSQS